MSRIPLHTFQYHATRPSPFEIGRLDRLPPAARASYPNRHTFYEIFWITGGAGRHVIDFVAHPIQPQTLYFVAPGQIHYWQIDAPLSGYAMLFPPEFFGPEAAPILDEIALFHPSTAAPAVVLRAAAAAEIDRLVGALVGEYEAPQFGQLTVLQALIQILLVRAQRAMPARTSAQPPDAAARLTRSFLRLVEQQYAELHSVAAYAAQLGVTSGHLTDTLRLTLGRSASTLVRARLILEAKRLLAHSDAPITTIAHQLHFGDPSYFSRVFRQTTGRSPQTFRADFREMCQASRDPSLA